MPTKQRGRDMAHLASLVSTRNDDVPNFALLLGSGASACSGVITAEQMIHGWRRQMYERSGSKIALQRWLSKQSWYGSDDEYSLLFEIMCDQPSQRRVHVEECLRNARPSWGYVYLTSLLKHRYFDAVLTTNFDDLVNEACFLFSEDLRPIVCAHDSAVSGIRIQSKRPKILKIHGDFLYDNIKNTVRELETLEQNTKAKVMQFAEIYGLVVVGYGGRDRSVMDVLQLLLRSDQFFKHGVYWCMMQGAKPGKRLQSLLAKDNVYTVSIPGFDQLMAYLHHRIGLDLPPPVADPIDSARHRARLFINVPESLRSDRLISQDIEQVLESVKQVASPTELPQNVDVASSVRTKLRLLEESIPSSLMGTILKDAGDLESALDSMKQALKEEPDDEDVAYEVADILARLGRHDELRELVKDSPMMNANKAYFLLHASDNDGALAVPVDTDCKGDPRGIMIRLNHAIALKRLGRTDEMNEQLRAVTQLRPPEHVRAGIAALRRDKKRMIHWLDVALAKQLITVEEVRSFVVFEDYWEDPDLKNLLALREQLEAAAEDDRRAAS